MKLDKENTRQILKIVVIAIVLFIALLNIQVVWGGIKYFIDIISPFIWGLAIAFILNIFMTIYENKVFNSRKNKNTSKRVKQKSKERANNLKRTASIILSIITIIAVITIILILIIPQFFEVIKNLISNIPNFLEDTKNFAIDITKRIPEVNNFIQSIQINTDTIKTSLMDISKNVLDITITQASNLISTIFNFIIAVVFAVYILANKEGLKVQAKKFIYARLDKEKADYVLKVSRLARDSFRSFLTGQAKEAIILGSLCALGMFVLGIPYAGPIGALTAITAFVPIVGAFISGFIGAVLIVAVDPIKAIIFLIFIVVLQQVEGNLIYPHVVGKNIGLPSIWVLVAITIGGSLFGIMGMIVGLPVVSIIYAIVSENTNKKLKEKNLENEF